MVVMVGVLGLRGVNWDGGEGVGLRVEAFIMR